MFDFKKTPSVAAEHLKAPVWEARPLRTASRLSVAALSLCVVYLVSFDIALWLDFFQTIPQDNDSFKLQVRKIKCSSLTIFRNFFPKDCPMLTSEHFLCENLSVVPHTAVWYVCRRRSHPTPSNFRRHYFVFKNFVWSSRSVINYLAKTSLLLCVRWIIINIIDTDYVKKW